MREVSFGQDGNVSTEGFEKRYTSELANEYGNLASRTLSMIDRYLGGQIVRADSPVADSFAGIREKVCDLFDAVQVTGALDEIWSRVRELNRFIQQEEPWKHGQDDPDRVRPILYGVAEGLRVVSLLLLPVIPESAGKLLDALGESRRELSVAVFGDWEGGQVAKIDPLFPRIEA